MARHPLLHLLHDGGAAAWFGGSLMGATGLNGAASLLDDPAERAAVGTAGWSRWAPLNAVAVGAHVVGAVGLLRTDLPRVRSQRGVARSSVVKAAVTGAALGTAVWSGLLNRRMAAAGAVPVEGATGPGAATPPDVARTQRQLALVQWLNPLLSGAVVVAGAWQEEQQRTAQVLSGVLSGRRGRAYAAVPVLAAAGAAGALVRRRRGPAVEAYPPPPVVDRFATTATPMAVAPVTGQGATGQGPGTTYGGSA